jgi:YfiH family protein
MFTYSQINGVQYVEYSRLIECNGIIHAFCTRWGGVSKGRFANLNFSVNEGDTQRNVAENWNILSNAFNIPEDHFFTVNQIHGDRILIIDDTVPDSHDPGYDGIITNKPGIAIGIKTADCVPIFLVDRVKHIIGTIHAGWKGTSLNIAGKALRILVNKFASKPEDIIVTIGPSIGPCCYEVDETVWTAMEKDPDRDFFFKESRKAERWMLDLPKANQRQILRAGISPENVTSAGICTSCHRDTFFSHRGEGGQTGRQLNFIMLQQKSLGGTE